MARKRPPLSFPELEHRGQRAILRSSDEVQAEEEQLAAEQGDSTPAQPTRRPSKKVSAPTDQVGDLEAIRRAVKRLGKEAATYRFTVEEKKALSDIVYTYKDRGIRTSENEITRIAINCLVDDYRANGNNSTLAQVLELLND
jgi:hypothetical protein